MAQNTGQGLGVHAAGERVGRESMPLRYNNDKPKNPSNDGRFEGLSHLFHSFSNHEKAGQKSKNREDVSLTTNAAAFGKHPDPNAAAAYKEVNEHGNYQKKDICREDHPRPPD